jgi:hypothetical protein
MDNQAFKKMKEDKKKKEKAENFGFSPSKKS